MPVSSTASRASASAAAEAARAMAVTTRSTCSWETFANARCASYARSSKSRASWIDARSACMNRGGLGGVPEGAEVRQQLVAVGGGQLAALEREVVDLARPVAQIHDLHFRERRAGRRAAAILFFVAHQLEPGARPRDDLHLDHLT